MNDKTADTLAPGDVIQTAIGTYRIDWLRPTFGGIEVHNRENTSRVLWFYPHQTVQIVGRCDVVPPRIPTIGPKTAQEGAP